VPHHDVASFGTESPDGISQLAEIAIEVCRRRGRICAQESTRIALTPGTRLGVYEITDSLGAGGMGEVYRARDTKLRRNVAIKILPEVFVADPDRVARFQREAELLATLNHPNIAQIYGLERQEGQEAHAIVLELVEGETLADVIARGPLALDEALPIARQIVDALEAAHERGVVHRDLKPGNIKITPDGKVKVLDFGLAKAMEGPGGPGGSGGMSMSPTLSVHATYAGIILGTAAYMSPEQARGKPVDRRTDIWAFGCVLYEMLTGKQAFEGGETVSDAVAAILRAEVDWTTLPAGLPQYLRRLLQRCLQKDPQKRLPHIGVVRLELDEPPADLATHPAPIAVAPARTRWPHAIAAALAAAALAVAGGLVVWRLKPVPAPVVTRFTIALPDGQVLTNTGRPIVAVSPDGTRIAYVANQRIYLRSMGDSDARPLQGSDTTGAVINPAFSPDSQSIVYYATGDQSLKRIAVTGGAPVTICAFATPPPYGLTWIGDTIFAGRGVEGIVRVAASGGKPETVVTVTGGEIAYGPQLLPDGDTLLFTIAKATGGTDRWDRAEIVAQSLKSGKRTTVVQGGADARYLPTGHIAYALSGIEFVVPFDASRLRVTGLPTPVIEGVRRAVPTPAAQVSVSSTGTLVYVPGPVGPSGQLDLALFDRQRTTHPLKFTPSAYETPRVSPDGRRITFTTDDGREAVVWLYDLSGATAMRRLTLGGRNRVPIWSADGQRVIYQSDRAGGTASIFSQRADGTEPAERLTTALPNTQHLPESVSPDGRYMLYAEVASATASLWLYAFDQKKAVRFGDVQSSNVPTATFSPDGRWVAYSTIADDRTFHIYVQPFPPNGAKYEISRGIHPFWSRDGKELFFGTTTVSEMAAVVVHAQPSFSFENPTSFYRPVVDPGPAAERPYDALPDGWFIGAVQPSAAASQPTEQTTVIQVVVNWQEELKQRVPTR